MQMMRKAVNGYVSTINAKANVRQKVIMIKTFSRGVNICFLLTFFKLVKKYFYGMIT